MSVVTGPDIVETNLVLSYDAMNIRSYPGSGSTWFDVSGYDNHGSINNGEYSSGWLQNSGNTTNFFYVITSDSSSLYNTFSTTLQI